jgi:hypothetical protein
MQDAKRQFGLALLAGAMNPNIGQTLASAMGAGQQAYQQGASQVMDIEQRRAYEKRLKETAEAQQRNIEEQSRLAREKVEETQKSQKSKLDALAALRDAGKLDDAGYMAGVANVEAGGSIPTEFLRPTKEKDPILRSVPGQGFMKIDPTTYEMEQLAPPVPGAAPAQARLQRFEQGGQQYTFNPITGTTEPISGMPVEPPKERATGGLSESQILSRLSQIVSKIRADDPRIPPDEVTRQATAQLQTELDEVKRLTTPGLLPSRLPAMPQPVEMGQPMAQQPTEQAALPPQMPTPVAPPPQEAQDPMSQVMSQLPPELASNPALQQQVMSDLQSKTPQQILAEMAAAGLIGQ